MTEKLFIPTKIKVGFNKRADTYTGKLGYVIAQDGKKWRKEPSWEGWREKYISEEEFEIKKRKSYDDAISQNTNQYNNMVSAIEKEPNKYNSDHWYRTETKKPLDKYLADRVGTYEKYEPRLGLLSSDKGIIPQEYDNVPTEGFVFNKKAGGYSSGWNHRATYCRVYDPRGFEFEIQLPNLLFILRECNCMKGKAIEGTFVYSWDGKDIVLLPTSSEDYVKSGKYSEMQKGKVSTKDLVEGCAYKEKSMDDLIYMGKFNWFGSRSIYNRNYNDRLDFHEVKKAFVFYSLKHKSFSAVTSMSNFIQKVTDTPTNDYADLLDKFNKSKSSGNLSGFTIEKLILPTEASGYNNNGNIQLGQVIKFISNDKYGVYELEGQLDYNSGNGYSTYSSYRKYKYNSFTAVGKKTVVIKDGIEFEIKAAKPTDITGSPIVMSNQDFNQIKLNKDNKNLPILF